MNINLLTCTLTLAACLTLRVFGYNLEDVASAGDTERDTTNLEPLERESNTELRKFLLKKLRFREVLRDQMMSPEEILKSAEADEEFEHKADKRQQMDDILSRVKALISNIKERQLKETMSLPSLRFGRSGMNFKVYHK